MIKRYIETGKITLIFLDISRDIQELIEKLMLKKYTLRGRILKEDNKMTLEFYDDSPKTKSLINEIIKISADKEVKDFEVKGLTPPITTQKNVIDKIDVVERNNDYNLLKDVVLEIGPYKGLTPQEALNKDGDKALSILMSQTGYRPLTKNAIAFFGKKWIANYKNITNEQLYNFPSENIKNFLKNYNSVMQNVIDKYVHKATYIDLNTLLEQTTDYMLKCMFKKVVDELYKKLQ